MIDRRDVLKLASMTAGALVGGAGGAAAATPHSRVRVRRQCPDTPRTRLAVAELRAGLRMLGLAAEVVEDDGGGRPDDFHIHLSINPRLTSAEAHGARMDGAVLSLFGGSEQGLLFAVFALLEDQGMTFGIDGSMAPIDLPRALDLPRAADGWRKTPRFETRGLLPWPDFLNCISVFNDEDFQAYFAAMLRMRMNMFGMHVYTDALQPTEAYLSFEFAGTGQQAVLETSAMRGWGYLPQRTSTYKMGSAQYFANETFGSDAMLRAGDNWDVAQRASAMLERGLRFARDLGIRTGVGFEPYKLPAAIADALPPEAKEHPGGFVESPTAKALLEARLGDLLERYPTIDYVWLWQDETSNWQSRNHNIPLSTTAFLQAHDFLRRHAPDKRLVVSGWGGITRHFPELHRRLPEDVVFAALSDTLGWDPVNEVFAALEGRERWPIPWLEDDPSMWFPQFRASRFESDMARAEKFGCQGMLGIHWRSRIVDPTVNYFARAGWDASLTAARHYRRFARSQAADVHADTLAGLMQDCDSGHAILSTYTGKRDPKGFAVHQELTPDYNEGFNYREITPDPTALPEQRRTAARFEALAKAAVTVLERNRLDYLAGNVGLMVPYCDALAGAHALDAILAKATRLRAAGEDDTARSLVTSQGIPLWCTLARQVRETILAFQHIVSTRNDQGQLASMQNKVVRIALERLRLSLGEFVTPLPAAVDAAYMAATAPDDGAMPRLFLPTRPSILPAGIAARLFIVAPNVAEDITPALSYRIDNGPWRSSAVRHEGRRVYSATLGPFSSPSRSVEYRASARLARGVLSDPVPGTDAYWLNILS